MPPDVATLDSRVRYRAPVGTALLGLSEGESIEWEFPDGSRRRLTLEKVLDQQERIGNSPLPRAP